LTHHYRVNIILSNYIIGDVDVNIAYLSADDFFGEMTLITGSRRVASAIALTDCNLHVMDKEAFMSNIANNRDFVSRILVTLAHRLEETDLSFTLLFKLISKSSKP
jgi:CRP-like cAMP-binding protein